MNKGILILMALFAGLSARECDDIPINDMILKGSIGGGDSLLVKNQWLPCSKILVESETVAEIEEGTVLGFVHPDPDNKIIVDGTLIINGRSKNPVIFSGYLDNSARSDTLGENTWGGIVVNNKGRLIIKGAHFFGAPIPVSGYSKDIEIYESNFKAGEKILLFSHRSYSLDSTGYIDSLLLSEYAEAPAPETETQAPVSHAKKADYKMGWKIPKPLVALIAGTTIIGGTIYGISAWIAANRPTPEERFLRIRPQLPDVPE